MLGATKAGVVMCAWSGLCVRCRCGTQGHERTHRKGSRLLLPSSAFSGDADELE